MISNGILKWRIWDSTFSARYRLDVHQRQRVWLMISNGILKWRIGIRRFRPLIGLMSTSGRGIAESDVEMSDFQGCFRRHPWDGLAPIVSTGTLMVRSITQHRTSPHALMFRIWPVSQIPLVAPTIRHQVPQSTRAVASTRIRVSVHHAVSPACTTRRCSH